MTALVLAACSGVDSAGRRIALLPLDNLTGDPDLDWISSAAPQVLAAELAGAGDVVPLRVVALRDAYQGRADAAVHGYVDRRGEELHFEFAVEDTHSHHMLDTEAFEGPVLDALARLAASLDSDARAFSTADSAAFEAWATQDFARAVSLDPGFGTAWLALARQQASSGQNSQALATIQKALSVEDLRSPVDRGQLVLLEATLRGDRGGQDQALAALIDLVPNDAGLLRNAADRATQARRFSEAAGLYQRVVDLDPGDPVPFNSLAYAQFFGGDLAGARRSLERYAGFEGHQANAADSQGEVLFMAGEFAEAERYFLEAHQTDPNLLAGADLLKAAYARWLAGDLDGADELFGQYAADRSLRGDRLIEWRQAAWEFSTGRAQQARDRITAAQGTLGDLAARQLAVWASLQGVPQDVDALEQAYLSVPPASDGLMRTLYARALAASGDRERARELVERWPLPDTGENLAASLVYPIYLELRNQLIPE